MATGGSTKKRVLEAPTEEAALEILMVASRSEARRRRVMNSERAKKVDGAMSDYAPDEVSPDYGQSAPDMPMGARGVHDAPLLNPPFIEQECRQHSLPCTSQDREPEAVLHAPFIYPSAFEQLTDRTRCKRKPLVKSKTLKQITT